jgi:hypothetical protein
MCEEIKDMCKFKFQDIYGELDEIKINIDKRFEKIDCMFEKYINDFQVVKEAIVGIDKSNEYIAKSLSKLEAKTEKQEVKTEKQQKQINQMTNDITMIKTLILKEPWYRKVLENLSNNKFVWLIIFFAIVAILQIPWEKIFELMRVW